METDPTNSSGEERGPSGDGPYRDEIVISWPELHRDARYLSRVLHELGDWKGIIAITRGGLVPAALVARELEIRLIDTVCVVSYGAGEGGGAEQKQGELVWLKTVPGDGDGWLLIDDLVDTGRTAQRGPGEAPEGALRDALREAAGPAGRRHLREGVPAGEVDLLPLGHRLPVRLADPAATRDAGEEHR